MPIEIEGRQYEFVIGTDVSHPEGRNGAYIEMRGLDPSGQSPFLIAFRRNATGKVTVSMYREDVPMEVLAYFLRFAGKELSTDHWPLWEDLE